MANLGARSADLLFSTDSGAGKLVLGEPIFDLHQSGFISPISLSFRHNHLIRANPCCKKISKTQTKFQSFKY